MKQFKLAYTRSITQVGVLILTPLIVIFTLGPICLKVIPDIEWLFYACAFVIVALAGVATLYAFRRFVMMPATITLTDEGFTIELDYASPFYHFKTRQFGWGNVVNASSNYDVANEQSFYTLKTQKPNQNIILLTLSPEDNMDDFAAAMNWYTEHYNQTNKQTHQITHRGFYDSTWSNWLTYIDIVLIVVFSVLYFIDNSHMQFHQLLLFYIFSASWLVNYFVARSGNKS